MKILITGAAGFIGNHLTRHFSLHHEVGVLLRPGARSERLAAIRPAPRQLVWDGTAQGMIALLASFRPDCVIHLATAFVGCAHKPEDIDAMIESNIRLPSLLLDAMVRAGCRDFINTGSISQHCENADYAPLHYFAASKQAFADILTYFVEAGGLRRAITLELSDTYGPDDPRVKLIQLLQKSAEKGDALGMSPGGQHLDYVHVEDIVGAYDHAVATLMKMPEGQQKTYAVRSGKPLTVKAFVELFNSLNPTPAKVEWNTRPYHGREFVIPWSQGEILPGWTPKIELRDGLGKLLAKAPV